MGVMETAGCCCCRREEESLAWDLLRLVMSTTTQPQPY